MTEATVSTIGEFFQFLRNGGYVDAEHAHVRFLYRGHGDEKWKLEPGVYRSDFKVGKQKAEEDEEDARLRTEQHLFQDFQVMSAGLRTGRETNVELYFLQQHHGMPTRLLDWTNNPLAALYFTLANKDHDKLNGKLFAMDAYQLVHAQGAVDLLDDLRGIATSGRNYVKAAVAVIAAWKKKDCFGEYAIAVRPDHLDVRMSLQRSCFTLHVPKCPRFELDQLNCLKALTIPATSKPGIRSELASLGIDDFSIYGDLDHLAQSLKAAYSR